MTMRRSIPLLTLVLILAAAPAACSDEAAEATPVIERTASVQDTPVSASVSYATAPAPEPRPINLTLPQWTVPQGGSFVAIVDGDGVTDAFVAFAGRPYPAVADGGGWLALIGVGQRVGLTEQHRPGVYPVEAVVTLAGGETRVLAGEVTVAATRFPVEEISLGPAESALLDQALVDREVAILRQVLSGFTPRRLWDGFFVRPTSGPITDVFGSRRSYNGGPATGSHSGTDFGADAGTPVRAAATGRVAFAGALPVRGNAVYIDHGAGVFTGYDHLSRIIVEAGQDVRAGEQIGNVGATGLVTGPHLHWEVAVGGYHVNGLLWLNGE